GIELQELGLFMGAPGQIHLDQLDGLADQRQEQAGAVRMARERVIVELHGGVLWLQVWHVMMCWNNHRQAARQEKQPVTQDIILIFTIIGADCRMAGLTAGRQLCDWSARRRSMARSSKARTFRMVCRPSRWMTWIATGGGPYSASTTRSLSSCNSAATW